MWCVLGFVIFFVIGMVIVYFYDKFMITKFSDKKIGLILDWPPKLVEINKEKIQPNEEIIKLQEKLQNREQELLIELTSQLINGLKEQIEKGINYFSINAPSHTIAQMVRKHLDSLGYTSNKGDGSVIIYIKLPNDNQYKYTL